MASVEAPKLYPGEYLVPVDRTERHVIEKTITYLYEYGTEVLLKKGYDNGRLKVSFFDIDDPTSSEADAVITILTVPGRQLTRRPLRFYCSESGVTALMLGGVNIGVIPEGVIVSPIKHKNQPFRQLQNREPEIIVVKLLHSLENHLPVIDVAAEMWRQWQPLHHEVLEQPLRVYCASVAL